jgi:acetoin utilization protein AcuB
VAKIDLKIDEFTTPAPLTAKLETTVEELRALMGEKGIRHLPISDGDKVVGIVTDRDLKTLELAETSEIKAKDFMTTDIFTVSSESPIEQVALEMSSKKIGSAIVTKEDGSLYGIFTSTDALNALVEVLRGEY